MQQYKNVKNNIKEKKIEKCDSSLATRQTGFWYLNNQTPKMKKTVFQKWNFFLTRKKKKKREREREKKFAKKAEQIILWLQKK